MRAVAVGQAELTLFWRNKTALFNSLALPLLLAATDVVTAVAGIALTGAGVGATFPLATSMHIGASERSADAALLVVDLASDEDFAALGRVMNAVADNLIARHPEMEMRE